MSILLAEEVASSSRGTEAALTGHQGFALSQLTAGLARECGQGVARDPLPDEPAHGLVFGEKTRRIRKKLAVGSQWVVLPTLL